MPAIEPGMPIKYKQLKKMVKAINKRMVRACAINRVCGLTDATRHHITHTRICAGI